MEIINVGLYGGKGLLGGKETPLEASVISCDKYMNCSYYKNNQCLKVRSFSGPNCNYGKVSTHKGYTRKAGKYYEFKRNWETHEKYSKLKNPSKKLGLIDEYIVFPYPYIRLEIKDNGEIKISDPGFFDKTPFIHREHFTVELIHRICNFKPRAMMGGEIQDYRKETVPLFLAHLKETLPEKYAELIEKYEGYEEKINYVGRKAVLHTVKPSLVHYKSDRYSQFNEEWNWDGEYLTYKTGNVDKVRITNDYEISEFKIKPSEKSMVTISNNSQVSERTIFID